MASAADVKYKKVALTKKSEMYNLIRACIAGSETVKEGRTSYLPNPDVYGPHATERYNAYVLRAVFYNVTGNTVKGMLGQVFSRDPVVIFPTLLEPMIEDVSGSGVSLHQQARSVVEDVLALGRHGLLTEYPRTNIQSEDGSSVLIPVTQADLDSGHIRPIILAFKPEDIINWRETTIGSKRFLSLVVLRDVSDLADDDSFDEKLGETYRELRLIDGVFVARFWVENENGQMEASEWITPTKADGTPFNEIPFSFVGADNNDATIDDAPMRDIAELNIAHYRNSADYEESVFMHGQATPVISGLTVQWVKEVIAEHPIVWGSRSAIKLPANSRADLLQAAPNSMVKEAMDTKEKQMVSLGARLVQQRDVQRTATEYGGDKATETSILTTISRNVTAAYLRCLRWACDYSGAPVDGLEFELNTDFDIAKMSPEEQQQLVASWQAKAISFTEMRFGLKKGGLAFQDDEEMREEAENDSSIRTLGLDDADELNPDGTPKNPEQNRDNPPEDE